MNPAYEGKPLTTLGAPAAQEVARLTEGEIHQTVWLDDLEGARQNVRQNLADVGKLLGAGG